MSVRSMTGFARADGSGADTQWTWEVRSVNGRGLDVRMRVPPGFDFIEIPARERIAARLVRGNLQLSLTAGAEGGEGRLTLNEEALDRVAEALAEVRRRIDTGPPSAEGVLALRGVLESRSSSAEIDPDTLGGALLASLDAALDDLVAAREKEGAAIAATLTNRLDEMASLAAAAEASPARTPAAIRKRLAEQVAALLETQNALDEARLNQEAVLLATRADIREELDRLSAHIAAARDLVRDGGAIGRRLDFLAQELNREVNTICAKSNDKDLSAIGLDLKAVVDQFREQVQNLE